MTAGRHVVRWLAIGTALILFGACGPCGGSTVTVNSGGSCVHPGICLTLTGPLAGATSGLVLAPDCITGAGLDAEFTTNIAGHETSIEIMITDKSAKATPGFHAGSFDIKTRDAALQSNAYASIWVNPDHAISGFTGGWSTDGAGSSGTVVVRGDESGTVENAVLAPAHGSGASLHISGTFNCR